MHKNEEKRVSEYKYKYKYKYVFDPNPVDYHITV